MTRALLALLLVSPAFAAEPVAHRVLAADRSTGKVAVVAADGQVEWEFPNRHDVHDLWLLPDGNVLRVAGVNNDLNRSWGREDRVGRLADPPRRCYPGVPRPWVRPSRGDSPWHR
jgi:hypothetical protein